MRYLLARAYAPLFFLGFIASATLLLQCGHSAFWLPALLLLAILISATAEALLPYRPLWNRSRRDSRRDLLHALVNESLNLLAVLCVPLLVLPAPLHTLWPTHWPLALQLLLAIPLADLGITLVHYASHRLPLLWRLHAVHHSVRRMYGFNGLMKHPLHQLLEALGGVVPMVLLGLPQDTAALLAFAIAIQLLLQHSNVDMRIGALRHLFAWAPVHRLHHLRYGRIGDVNFALFFSVWDRLLGTALHLPGYALADDDLGIGDRPDYPDDYLAQLCEPFRHRDGATAAAVPDALRRALVEQAHAQVAELPVGTDAEGGTHGT